MNIYLPDSNVFILAFHGKEPEATFLRYVIEQRRMKISNIVLAEIYSKDIRSERGIIDELIMEFGYLEIDDKISRIAGEYRHESIKKSKRAFLIDCFLAAQAKVHNLVLVTNNKSDFPMKDIKIISPQTINIV